MPNPVGGAFNHPRTESMGMLEKLVHEINDRVRDNGEFKLKRGDQFVKDWWKMNSVLIIITLRKPGWQV